MPRIGDPGSTGTGGNGSFGVMTFAGMTQTGGVWVPGPIVIPDDEPVVIGSLVMPYGPRTLEYTRQPNVAKQITLGAVILYDFGWLPNTYSLEGYANGASIADMMEIVSQFGVDPLSSVRLLAPILAIADMVRLVKWNPSVSGANGPNEPMYRLDLETSSGGYSEIVNGVVSIQ